MKYEDDACREMPKTAGAGHKEPEVRRAMGRLQKVRHELEAAVDNIEVRLGVVLRDEEPSNPSGDTTPNPDCELGGAVILETDCIELQARRLARLLERLEI